MREIRALQVSGLNDPSTSDQAVTKNYADLQAQAVSTGAGVWNHYSATYSSLAAASLTNDIELFQIPAGGVIHDVIIIPSASFTGGAITAYQVSVGISGDLDKYAVAFDVFQAPGSQVFESNNSVGIENKTSPTSIRLAAVSVGDTLNNATAGAVDVYIRWSIVTQAPLSGTYITYDEFFYSAHNTGATVAQNYNTANYFTVSGLGTSTVTFSILQQCSIDLAATGTFILAAQSGGGSLTITYNGSYVAGMSCVSYGTGQPIGTSGSAKLAVTNGDAIVVTYSDNAGTLTDSYITLSGRSLKPVIPSLPAGIIQAYGGSAAPAGYLICDGSVVSRSSYAALFSAIGSAFGGGDGTTTFNLPDLRGQFLRGVDGGAGIDPDTLTRTALNPGGNTGDAVGSEQASIVGQHNHILNTPSGWGANNGGNRPYWDSGDRATGQVAGQYTDNGDTGVGNETRPTNVYVNYIIKY